MAVTGVGSTETAYRNHAADEDMVFKTYSYKDGKGEETVYHLKDCLQLSVDSYTIPVGSDTYEALKNKIHAPNVSYMDLPGNKMFYESYEVMKDYYDGKISDDEVKNIFREYFYHAAGGSSGGWATRCLAGLYEHFSRANTRVACTNNNKEGRELLESQGFNSSGSYYYNADWYWKCENMQSLFRETANELADECGAERVDFEYVEKNTKFTLDGGITYNGVWASTVWQMDAWNDGSGNLIDTGMVPPQGFVYCSCPVSDAAKTDMQSIKEALRGTEEKQKYAKWMFLAAVSSDAKTAKSLLLDKKNYVSFDGTAEDSLHKTAMDFLKNFHIKYRNSRMEFLAVKQG